MRRFFDLNQINLPLCSQSAATPDLIVGIRESLVNTAITSIFKGIYPACFKNQLNFPKAKICFRWDIDTPPRFSFRKSAVAMEDFNNFCAQVYTNPDNHMENVSVEDIEFAEKFVNEFLVSSNPVAMELNIPSIMLKVFRSDDVNIASTIKIKAMLACYVSVDEDAVLSIVPFAGRIDDANSISDMVMEIIPEFISGEGAEPSLDLIYLFINEVLLPFVLTACKNLIPKIKIPQLKYSGVCIGNYSIDFEDNCLLVKTTIDKASTDNTEEIIEPVFAWPSQEIFINANSHAITTVADGLLPIIKDALRNKKVSGSGYRLTCNVELGKPKVSLDSSNIRITSDLTGSVVVTIGFWFFSISAAVFVESKKPLELYFMPQMDGSQVYIKLSDMSEILLDIRIITPGILGFVAERILSLITSVFPNAIRNVLELVLNKVSVFKLPEFEFEAFGLEMKTELRNANAHLADYKLTVASNLSLTAQRKQKDRLLPTEKLLPGEFLLSGTGAYALNYSNEGKIELISVLSNTVIWQAQHKNLGSEPKHLVMQTDGNLVAYDQDLPYWATNTSIGETNKNSIAVLESNGSLVLYRTDGVPIWNTNG